MISSGSKGRMAVYRPQGWEKALAAVIATAIIVVSIIIVLRNDKFNDPNIVVLMRIMLSLSIAILGATIPGFMNVGWTARGITIRAGGALALFVLTYVATPPVLPSDGLGLIKTTGPASPVNLQNTGIVNNWATVSGEKGQLPSDEKK
jgi:hypothetical protein